MACWVPAAGHGSPKRVPREDATAAVVGVYQGAPNGAWNRAC